MGFIKLQGDKKLWIWYLAIFITAMVVTSSSTTDLSIALKHNSVYFWLRHLKFMLVGLVIIYGISRLNASYLDNLYAFADFFIYITIAMLIATDLVGIGKADAKRWLSLFGFKFQPSEVAKVALIIYAAKQLTIAAKKKSEQISAMNNLFTYTLVIAALVGYYNLSGAIIIAVIVGAMVYTAELDKKVKLMLLKKSAYAGAALLLIILFAPADFARVDTWRSRLWHKAKNTENINDQSFQAKIALAHGPLLSIKPGSSKIKSIIPQSHSDYLFSSVIIPEFGIAGGIWIISLYIALLFLTAQTVYKLRRAFLAYLAIGFSLSIVTQAFIHILVNVNLFPVTGQPLPFLSMGGTSIFINSVMVGFIICISAYAYSKKNKQKVQHSTVDDTIDKQKIIIG